MQQAKNYSISKESTDDMIEAGRFNPSLEITFQDSTGRHTHKISAGYGDEIGVYQENDETYVINQSPGLCYVGLQVFTGPDIIGEAFVADHEMAAVFGESDPEAQTLIERLREYIY
jgi:hypothetical protein